MGPLPYQPLSLSFFAESCYLDSNGHQLSASLSADRPWTGQGIRQGKIVAHAASEPARTPQLLLARGWARAAWRREVSLSP